MVHDIQTIRDHLAFMRVLAQEGRRAPMVNGRSLFVGGLIYAAASLVAGAISIHLLAVPQVWQGVVWIVATGLYVPYIVYRKRVCLETKPGATAITNRAVGAAWRGLGYVMLSLLAASWLLAFQFKSDLVFAMWPSIVLAIYGGAWVVAAAMSEVKWLKPVAALCFIASVAIALTVSSPLCFPILAAALLVVMALPGWLLMRDEPTGVV
jgi:hypothetical protein